MEAPLTLADCKVAILGLGLMGGSLALALKGKTAALYGVDPKPEVIELALGKQIIQRGSTQPSEVLPEADLVILAAPVNGILKLLGELPELHPGSPVVLDLGSTKARITAAMAELPARFDPAGGHPMCGSHKTGLENASPDMFKGAPFALCSMPRTTPRARALAEDLILAVGARPVLVDPSKHDRWTAATSHVPYVLACALASATPMESAPLVGPGFRSTTRVAGTSAQVMLDILSTNRAEVLEGLARVRRQLEQIEELLRCEDWQGLASALEQAASLQARLAGSKP